jgi:ubiquitin-protein ligase
MIGSMSIHRLVKELHKLVVSPLEDIRVVLNEDDLMDIQAWIKGPGKSNIIHPLNDIHL